MLFRSATAGTSATPGCATPVHDWTLAREVLAPTRDRGGPPGYGDWPSVARDYPAVVPGALAAGRCAVAVNHPDWTLAVGDILLMNAAERRETLAGLDLWAGMRSRFVQPGERVVPVYVDLVPWKR